MGNKPSSKQVQQFLLEQPTIPIGEARAAVGAPTEEALEQQRLSNFQAIDDLLIDGSVSDADKTVIVRLLNVANTTLASVIMSFDFDAILNTVPVIDRNLESLMKSENLDFETMRFFSILFWCCTGLSFEDAKRTFRYDFLNRSAAKCASLAVTVQKGDKSILTTPHGRPELAMALNIGSIGCGLHLVRPQTGLYSLTERLLSKSFIMKNCRLDYGVCKHLKTINEYSMVVKESNEREYSLSVGGGTQGVTVGTDLKFSTKDEKSVKLSQIDSDDIRVDTQIRLTLNGKLGFDDIGGDFEMAWLKLEANPDQLDQALELVTRYGTHVIIETDMGSRNTRSVIVDAKDDSTKSEVKASLSAELAGTAKLEAGVKATNERSISSKAKKERKIEIGRDEIYAKVEEDGDARWKQVQRMQLVGITGTKPMHTLFTKARRVVSLASILYQQQQGLLLSDDFAVVLVFAFNSESGSVSFSGNIGPFPINESLKFVKGGLLMKFTGVPMSEKILRLRLTNRNDELSVTVRTSVLSETLLITNPITLSRTEDRAIELWDALDTQVNSRLIENAIFDKVVELKL